MGVWPPLHFPSFSRVERVKVKVRRLLLPVENGQLNVSHVMVLSVILLCQNLTTDLESSPPEEP